MTQETVVNVSPASTTRTVTVCRALVTFMAAWVWPAIRRASVPVRRTTTETSAIGAEKPTMFIHFASDVSAT